MLLTFILASVWAGPGPQTADSDAAMAENPFAISSTWELMWFEEDGKRERRCGKLEILPNGRGRLSVPPELHGLSCLQRLDGFLTAAQLIWISNGKAGTRARIHCAAFIPSEGIVFGFVFFPQERNDPTDSSPAPAMNALCSFSDDQIEPRPQPFRQGRRGKGVREGGRKRHQEPFRRVKGGRNRC